MNPSHPSSQNSPEASGSHDFDWLAFCYLCDELTPAERTSFEESLATEQFAREALASAVEWTSAVSAEFARQEEPVAVPARPVERWMQWTAWISIATAASVAVAIAYGVLFPGPEQIATSSPGKHLPETALVWSQIRESWAEANADSAMADPLSGGLFRVETELAVDAGDGELDGEEASGEASMEMPSWLLTALSSRSEDGTSSFDEPQEDSESQDHEEL